MQPGSSSSSGSSSSKQHLGAEIISTRHTCVTASVSCCSCPRTHLHLPARHALQTPHSTQCKHCHQRQPTCCRLSLDHSCCHTAEETCCTLPPAASAAAAAAANSGACLNDRLTLKPASPKTQATEQKYGKKAVSRHMVALQEHQG
jgi:hypothetical protein